MLDNIELSIAQIELLKKLKAGNQITYHTQTHIRRCMGKAVRNVSFSILYHNGFIEAADRQPTLITYKISEKGLKYKI